jgi:activator of HSP90 ATPase
VANAVYPLFKGFLLTAAASVSLNVNDATDGPFVALVDTGTYTYSAAHDFYNDLSGIVGTDQRIATPTTASGLFDGDNLTYTAVSGATVEALVIYRHNAGANSTWKLVAYIDTSVTGLPVTPNGGDITVTWNASGIIQF